MAEMTYKKVNEDDLGWLLAGYLHGLGGACQALFGKHAKSSLYCSIGEFHAKFIGRTKGTVFEDRDPWKRFQAITEFFTTHGFFSRAELDALPEGRYRIRTSDGYSNDVWKEVTSEGSGLPPCPYTAMLVYSLGEIGYRIATETMRYDPEARGFESVFHFEKREPVSDSIGGTRLALWGALVPICSNCYKMQDRAGRWVRFEKFFEALGVGLSHGLCPDCVDKLYPGVRKGNEGAR